MDFQFVPSVTFWLVNRKMMAGQVKQVCNRKGHMMRITRLDLDRVQRIAVERGTCSWSEVSLTSLQGGASVGTPWLLEEDMGRRSPLSEYMSLHPSLTYHINRDPFENKVWEIYFLLKKKKKKKKWRERERERERERADDRIMEKGRRKKKETKKLENGIKKRKKKNEHF